jgi:acetylornithine deacetylase/succinyl-diaminopimelate desuccinylase-like protein
MTHELQDLFNFLSFPSVSTDSNHKGDVRACANWIVGKLSAAGLATQLHETPGNPIVVARNTHRPDRKTVLIYGHYDVQPVDPLNLWDSPPFSPEIRDGKIWARGSTDNKGQMLAHILGVEKTLAEKGDLPVNIILLFEGEEEIGSPNLAPFLEAHKAELACDIIAISDTGMVAPNSGTLGYGLRGIACCEVKVKGPARDLHSGLFGGAVTNPATGAVKVPAERLQEARLQMAAAGLGQLNGSGMEMIERDPGFGVSQFVETARYQRALETELARTIGNLRPVREARVHLALPKPSAFTRQREPAAASVVARTAGATGARKVAGAWPLQSTNTASGASAITSCQRMSQRSAGSAGPWPWPCEWPCEWP